MSATGCIDLLAMRPAPGPDPCMETERDSEGFPIIDPVTGYKLTARAVEASRKKFVQAVKMHPPMKEIPYELIPTLTRQNKPLLHWGLACSDEQLVACVVRNNLMEWDPEKPEFAVALFKVLDYLRAKCGVALKRERPLSADHIHVITLYSNFSMADTVMPWKVEERAVAIIRDELEISDPTQWWWDLENAYKPWY